MAWDAARQRAASRRHYEANREELIRQAATKRTVDRERNREYVRGRKTGPCADCGHRFPHYVMQFDHVRGTKRDNVATLMNAGVSIATLAAEIALCDLVCANCHAIRTWNRKRA